MPFCSKPIGKQLIAQVNISFKALFITGATTTTEQLRTVVQ